MKNIRARLVPPPYLLVFAGGLGVGFFIHYRKVERGFDSLINIRLLILMLLFALAMYCVSSIEAAFASMAFSTVREKAFRLFSYSYGAMALLFLYPATRMFVFSNWQTSFRWMALCIALLAGTLQVAGLFSLVRESVRDSRLTLPWRIALALICMGLLFCLHQRTYSRSPMPLGSTGEVWSNLEIDHDARRALIWVTNSPYRFEQGLTLGEAGSLIVSAAVLNTNAGGGESHTLRLRLFDEGGRKLEEQTQTVEIGNGWGEVAFELKTASGCEVFAEVWCSPSAHGSLNSLRRELVSYLRFPWLDPPSGSRIAFSQPRFVGDRNESFPNVILISIDTLRADRVGAGTELASTPAMDGLAEDGILFSNVIAPATWTLPSHISLMTSLYPSYHGIFDRELEIPELPQRTLPKIFQNGGYATAAFTGGGFVSKKFGLSKGFDLFYAKKGIDCNEAADIFSHASDWIQRNKGHRFFLFLHTFETHDYVYQNERHKTYADNQYNGVFTIPKIVPLLYNLQASEAEQSVVTRNDIQYLEDLYRGAIEATDKELQKLLIFLNSRELLRDTLIVLTSDHGESFGEAHYKGYTEWHHGYAPYEGQVRVPLIIKPPANLLQPGQSVFEQRVSLLDVAPTILDICSIPVPEQFAGVSLKPLMQKGEYDKGRIIFSEELGGKVGGKFDSLAVYSGGKVFIHFPHPAREDELYDIEKDPKQLKNLQDQEDSEELMSIVTGYLAESAEYQTTTYEKKKLDKQFESLLRALGYL